MDVAFLISVHYKMEDLWLSRNTWGKGFHKKRLFSANVCGNGCNALRLRRAKLAPKSPVLFWLREYLQPSLHVLATFPARTCGKNPAGGVSVNFTSVAPTS